MADPAPPGFGALVGLITLGSDADDSLCGELLLRTGEDEVRVRVWRSGRLSRRETIDGTVLEIEGEAAVWTRYDGDVELTAVPRRVSYLGQGITPIGALEVGGPRPTFTRWDGAGFTRPLGPIGSGSFLGRAAYTVRLAPPPGREPQELVVDAETGLLLRLAEPGDAPGTDAWSVQWSSVQVGVDIDPALFTWTGPSHPPSRPRIDIDHERQLAERQAWLSRRGITGGELAVRPDLMLHAWDEQTGEFHIGFDTEVEGSVLRRPHAATTWPEANRLTWPYVYRWTDERWDWFVGSNVAFDDDQLAAWRERAAATT